MLPFLRKCHLVTIRQFHGNVGMSFWWLDDLPDANQLGLRKRCRNLATSSVAVEFCHRTVSNVLIYYFVDIGWQKIHSCFTSCEREKFEAHCSYGRGDWREFLVIEIKKIPLHLPYSGWSIHHIFSLLITFTTRQFYPSSLSVAGAPPGWKGWKGSSCSCSELILRYTISRSIKSFPAFKKLLKTHFFNIFMTD